MPNLFLNQLNLCKQVQI